MTGESKIRAATIAGITLLLGLILGMFLPNPFISTPDQEDPLTPTPISQTISGEAREYCLDHDTSLGEITEHPEACLRQYWTMDRLLRSERLHDDWLWDSGWYDDHCDVATGICNLIAGPGLPPDSDPWWDRQPTRDPGRTTKAGTDVQASIERSRIKNARDANTPLDIEALPDAERIKSWCLKEPDEHGYLKKTRQYTIQELKQDARPCLADWLQKPN